MPEPVILDACCTLNLSATGRVEQILRELPFRFRIGSKARNEAQWLVIPGSEEREIVELQPLVEAGLLEEECLSGPEEEALYVAFSARIDEGEAEAAALAVSRGCVLAADDRKARSILTARPGDLRLTGTPELLHRWQQEAGPPPSEMADALRRIAERATYRPPRTDLLWHWWVTLAAGL